MKRLQPFIIPVLFAVMGIVILLPVSPAAQGDVPGRDSGVFLYMGHALLDGQIPYRDVWDHKPPLIYFIDALGLLLLSNSYWGVWLIEVVFLTIALWAGYYGLRRIYPRWMVLLSLSLMVSQLPYVIQEGNLTEFYALTFQFGMIFLLTNTHQRYRYSGIGILGGLTFMLRQNLIGLWLAIGVLVLWQNVQMRDWRTFLRQIGAMVGGATITVGIISLWFALHGALYDIWSATFIYNFAYVDSGGSTANQLQSSLAGIQIGMYPILPILWIIGSISLWQSRQRLDIQLVAVILFPLDMFLGTISGQTYPHYYMLWLPLFVLLLTISLNMLHNISKTQRVLNWHIFENSRFAVRHYLGLIVGTVIGVWLGIFVIAFIRLSTQSENRFPTRMYRATATFLNKNSQSSEPLLVWGNEAYLHTFTHHEPISRYIYQYPLTRRGYANATIINDFFTDLQTMQPQFIVDTPNPNMPPLRAELRADWEYTDSIILLPELWDLISWIDENYELVECFEATEFSWCIYGFNPLSSE